MSVLYYFEREVESSMMVAVKWAWDNLADDERETWDADTARESFDYDGRWHEVVDGCVPIYTKDVVDTWFALGMPEAENYGSETDSSDIIKQMMVGIYYWADDYARRNFESWFETFDKGVTDAVSS